MAEQDLIKEEEEKKKKKLEEQKARQQAISITSADKNFFNNISKKEENEEIKNNNIETKQEDKTQIPKVPELPKADLTFSKKCKKISKDLETSSYFAKVLTWIFFPLTIGAFATGLGALATLFMLLTVISIGFVYGSNEIKEIFSNYAINDEKEALKKNASKLEEYYKKCEELNIEPLSPNKELSNDEKAKIKAEQQKSIDQAFQQKQQKQQKTQQSEQTK